MSQRDDMMPLWTDAYLADTQDLDAIQHGMYFLLLMRAWRSGKARLKNDERALSNICKVSLAQWRKHSPAVMQYWTLEGDYWVQKRLLKQWQERLEYKAKQSERAKNSEQKRKNSQKWNRKKPNENNGSDPAIADADAVADVETSKSNPNSSQSRSVSQSGKSDRPTDDLFDEFWDCYPHAQPSSQAKAIAEWVRLSPEDQRKALTAAKQMTEPPRGLFAFTWLAQREWLTFKPPPNVIQWNPSPEEQAARMKELQAAYDEQQAQLKDIA